MCLAVLNVAARHADPELARSVIRILSSRRSTLASHHYEALLEATIKSQDLKTALRILTIMSKGGIEPDSGITRSLYLYLSQFVHLPYEAWNILKSMREEGHIIPTGAVNVILEASVFQRNIEEAIDLYKQLHTVCASGPNTETFNVLLQGLRRSKSSMKDTAMFLAAEMTALGVKPDRITYDRLILVCLDEGDYEDAFKYLEEMIMVGTSRGETWWMRKGTVSRLIQICTVAGDKRAWELLEEMGKREIRAVDLKQWVRENWKSSRVIEKRSSSHRE
jgi:pentatricopeptide repeat protein